MDVFEGCASGAKGGSREYCNAGNDGGTGSDEGEFLDGDVAAHGCAGGDVDEVTDCAVVIYAGFGVDDGVVTDCGAGLNNCPSADQGSLADFDFGRDDGGRMDEGGESTKFAFGDGFSGFVVADGDEIFGVGSEGV